MPSIALQTKARRDIDNEQITEISSFELAQFRGMASQAAGTRQRVGPTPVYNCHGMTFASRRTGVFETATLVQIIAEDGYREVAREDVMAGDVILYHDDSGDIEHSGVVVTPPSVATLWVPMVYSKWGKYAELEHFGNRCPYNFANIKYYRMAQ